MPKSSPVWWSVGRWRRNLPRSAGLADPKEIALRAAEIAAHGNAALSLLLTRLDTEDPQLRASLGQVARILDHDQVVAALRRCPFAATWRLGPPERGDDPHPLSG